MKIDTQQVHAAFHSTGSSDVDILSVRKEELLALTRKQLVTGIFTLSWGIGLCLTVVGAAAGVPAIRRGIGLRRCAARNTQTIEAAYRDYLAAIAERRKKTLKRTL